MEVTITGWRALYRKGQDPVALFLNRSSKGDEGIDTFEVRHRIRPGDQNGSGKTSITGTRNDGMERHDKAVAARSRRKNAQIKAGPGCTRLLSRKAHHDGHGQLRIQRCSLNLTPNPVGQGAFQSRAKISQEVSLRGARGASSGARPIQGPPRLPPAIHI